MLILFKDRSVNAHFLGKKYSNYFDNNFTVMALDKIYKQTRIKKVLLFLIFQQFPSPKSFKQITSMNIL